jgi:metal-sulfur cluster biosynthetic enzyme
LAIQEDITDILRTVVDPEIGLNIVDLGLIYEIQLQERKALVKMTLTTPGCPLHATISQDVKEKVESLDGIQEADVQIVWDPPWTVDRLSPEAKKELGFE